jgi:hypothetical protein
MRGGRRSSGRLGAVEVLMMMDGGRSTLGVSAVKHRLGGGWRGRGGKTRRLSGGWGLTDGVDLRDERTLSTRFLAARAYV